ncbi:hypothetical protein CFB35_09240 [Burkholderia sp. AU16482]|nr:hypothetical protein CFB35_09240 [Burkholderia sp. AU16482]
MPAKPASALARRACAGSQCAVVTARRASDSPARLMPSIRRRDRRGARACAAFRPQTQHSRGAARATPRLTTVAPRAGGRLNRARRIGYR